MALALVPSRNLARPHIHEIRTQKFSIGRKDRNPLTNDLHHAVVSLSRELYTKDVHFLMELIQNAEDNEYGAGVEPTLELVLTDEDLTHSGSPATLLVFNNEIRFTRENMDSICSIGLSTKKGKRNQGNNIEQYLKLVTCKKSSLTLFSFISKRNGD